MSGLPVDSHLELLILEGEGKGESHPLKHAQIVLGRSGIHDSAQGRIGFREPTVSGTHAQLEWDARARGFNLLHLSKTNPTYVNGGAVDSKQRLREGDRIQMGRLVAKVVHSMASVGPGGAADQSNFRLLVMTGPEKGSVRALPPRRSLLRSPRKDEKGPEEVIIGGLLDTELEVLEREGQLHLRGVRLANALKIFESYPGAILEYSASADRPYPLREGALVGCGTVAFTFVKEGNAMDRRAELMEGEMGHPALSHIPQAGPHSFGFSGPQEDSIRVVSGPLRHHKVWITPEELTTPFRFGKTLQAGLCLPEPEVAEAELSWDGERLCLRNVDDSLNLGFNWDQLAPGEQRALHSGDRFKLGSSELVYECAMIQYQLGRLAICFEDEEMPFLREVSLLGSGPQADFFINAELAEAHGRVRVSGEGEVTYRQLNSTSRAQLGGVLIEDGEEHLWAVGQALVLGPDITLNLIQPR